MSKVFRFKHPDGKVLVVTQDPNDPTRSSTHFEDADGNRLDRNLSTAIHDEFASKVAGNQ